MPRNFFLYEIIIINFDKSVCRMSELDGGGGVAFHSVLKAARGCECKTQTILFQ